MCGAMELATVYYGGHDLTEISRVCCNHLSPQSIISLSYLVGSESESLVQLAV